MKRIISLSVAVFIFAAFGVHVFAASTGFSGPGDYSDSKVSFGFETLETVIVYNNEVYDDPDFDAVWPGSSIYIPVYTLGASGQQPKLATDKDIKGNEVTLSYKVVAGDRHIDNIELADGKKAKITALKSGTYAKIDVSSSSYTGGAIASVKIKLVLSVRKLSYTETQIELDINISNRLVLITQNTVYAAQSPTNFRALKGYGGAATFDFGGKVRYSSTVSKGASYYLNLDRADQQPIKQKFPNAYLEFYNFLGNTKTFASAGTLEIPIDRAKYTPKKATQAQVYVYEINGDTLKTLDERTISFDAKKNLLNIKTSVLGNYVVSSEPLLREIDDDSDAILYTGYADPSSADSTVPSGASSSAAGQPAQQQSGGTVTAYPNENVNTGLAIEADNVRAVNPSTSDKTSAPAAPLMLVSGAGVAMAAAMPGKKKKTL